jgi:hypothetical protein
MKQKLKVHFWHMPLKMIYRHASRGGANATESLQPTVLRNEKRRLYEQGIILEICRVGPSIRIARTKTKRHHAVKSRGSATSSERAHFLRRPFLSFQGSDWHKILVMSNNTSKTYAIRNDEVFNLDKLSFPISYTKRS